MRRDHDSLGRLHLQCPSFLLFSKAALTFEMSQVELLLLVEALPFAFRFEVSFGFLWEIKTSASGFSSTEVKFFWIPALPLSASLWGFRSFLEGLGMG